MTTTETTATTATTGASDHRPQTTVSDTAHWVAVYRAHETARKDALFRDPLADKVAGARGRAMVAALPRMLRTGWSVVARTKLIDDLILAAVADGCDRVINMAAGLDTRPYRLPLPASLVWIEADLPALVTEKEAALTGERPTCTLTRERVDLADPAARAAFLDRALEGARRALVLTEGLLMYLEDQVVAELGRDLAARPAVQQWIFDVFSPTSLAMLKRVRGHAAAQLMRFAPASGVAFFEPLGWKVRDVQSIFRAAVRFRRAPLRLWPLVFFRDPDPRNPARHHWYSVVRLERN